MFRFLLPCLLFLACNFSAVTISDAQNSRAKNPQARKSGAGTSVGQLETPRSLDDRLKISLFAAEPDVVTPTGIAVNAEGRVFCIESHTHFRPKNYQGPPADRIRIYDDTDGDGRADRVKTFFEGSTATMNMAFAPDGSLYVATRARIFRLVDDNGDDKPDSNTVIVALRTEGNYPHNGLSGLAFQDNQLYFGFGENLGVDYRLVGSDNTTLSGGGEGGNIYACNLDGSELRRVATGFWNPFGLAFDKGGNLIAVDNDPDWRPPCRLLHIVEGGDYGYRFSHGRRGTHPFTAWFGELSGTLGLVSGTGEAPSGIVRCDPLSPDETTSSVLSTSWGLHSIELFDLQEDGATYRSVPQTLIKGGKDFRPVSLAWGPDGSLYVSDWCKRSYELHGYGRIWKIQIRGKETTATQSEVPTTYPYDSSDPLLRQIAANRMVADRIDFPRAIQAALTPLEKASLLRRCAGKVDPTLLLAFFRDSDPFVRQAARHAFENSVTAETLARLRLPENAGQRAELALVMRKFSSDQRIRHRVSELLADNDPRVRFIALRWIGEEKLAGFSQQLATEIRTRPMTGRLFESSLAALDMLQENRKGAEYEKREAGILVDILKNGNSQVETVITALRKLQAVSRRDSFQNHPALKLELLKRLLQHDNPEVVREAIQTVRDLDSKESREVLLEIVQQRHQYGEAANEAVIGLDPADDQQRTALLSILIAPGSCWTVAARQSVQQATWNEADRRVLQRQGLTLNSLTRAPVSRISGGLLKAKGIVDRMATADADRGRLIFYNRRFGQCATCHQVDGRGGMIGPDLSHMSDNGVERLLESILQPGKEIAPRYTGWMIQTYDGKTVTGVLVAERGEVQTFADASGKLHKIRFDDIEEKKPVAASIMPEGLTDRMTDQEVADLIAFLRRKR